MVIDGHSSGWSEVTSGVPQGSILGPLPFLVHINDFPLAFKCNCGHFADDSILHRKVTSDSDCKDLQTDLQSAYDWCNSWLVTSKSEKSKVLHLSRSKDPFHHEYWLSDKPLSVVDHHKHLGFWLESSLSWDYHINYICAKANKVLGLIRRTFGPNNSEGVSTAYKTLVRPILEYGCQVWNPYLVKNIKGIESIQRRATRVTCGSEKEYQERLGVLKWPSLALRRRFICLVQMYKIIFGHCDIDPHMFFDFNVLAKTRKDHNFKIRFKKTPANYFKFSFFNRYIKDWNSIPSKTMHAPSLSSSGSPIYLLDPLCQF